MNRPSSNRPSRIDLRTRRTWRRAIGLLLVISGTAIFCSELVAKMPGVPFSGTAQLASASSNDGR